MAVDNALAKRVRKALTELGYDVGSGSGYDDGLKRTLFDFVGTENLEERWSDEAKIDHAVLDYLFTRSE